jgi:hypothetical protein
MAVGGLGRLVTVQQEGMQCRKLIVLSPYKKQPVRHLPASTALIEWAFSMGRAQSRSSDHVVLSMSYTTVRMCGCTRSMDNCCVRLVTGAPRMSRQDFQSRTSCRVSPGSDVAARLFCQYEQYLKHLEPSVANRKYLAVVGQPGGGVTGALAPGAFIIPTLYAVCVFTVLTSTTTSWL